MAINARRASILSVLTAVLVLGWASSAHAQSSFADRTPLDWPNVLTGAFLGFLLIPLLYNAAFYAMLRERFLIWHAARAVIVFGLTVALSSLPLGSLLANDGFARQVMIHILFDLSVAVSGPFVRGYIEEGKLSPLLNRALGWVPVAVMSTTLAMIYPDWSPAYMAYRYVVMIAVLILMCTVLVQAIGRGSRAARYQVAAWIALIAVYAISIFHDVVLGYPYTDFLFALFAAFAFEVPLTAVGIADRMIRLRRDHDLNKAATAALAVLAHTDPLTGLANRRHFEATFASHRPRAIAIVDLDHFKGINDRFGHDVGDKVIVATAQALSSGQAFVARIGGEEFALLLSSSDPEREAELLRQRISQHVARDVEGLNFPVTASVGIANVADSAPYTDVMKAADQALYRAKERGRNRVCVAPARFAEAA
jgi:diguanylate cyclase